MDNDAIGTGSNGNTGSGADNGDVPSSGRKRLTLISPEAYRHPLDRQATAALRAVPGFELAASKISRYSFEQLLYVEACAAAVKVTPQQCPRVYALLREACAILDLSPEPTLFLSQHPFANAFAMGREKPTMILQTGIVELLTEDELLAVIAHELGHIQCGHSIYRLMALLMQLIVRRAGGPALGEIFTIGLQVALLEWMRKAEYSADRAALLVVQDPEVVFNVLFKLTGGSPKIFDQMDRDEYLRQADEFDSPEQSTLDKVYKMLLTTPQDHPIPVLRAREALRYGDSDDYRRILSGDYPRREKNVPEVRESRMVTCPNCGAETDGGAFSFCTNCGADLPREDTTATPPEPPQPEGEDI